jgi:hypothetical protein
MPDTLSFENFVKTIQRGHIFTVTFIKRNSEEVRTMNCRIGVEKHLAGGDLNYNPLDKGLIVVWDLNKKGYRQIPVEGIVSLVLEGKLYNYDKEKQEFIEIW